MNVLCSEETIFKVYSSSDLIRFEVCLYKNSKGNPACIITGFNEDGILETENLKTLKQIRACINAAIDKWPKVSNFLTEDNEDD